MQKITLGKTGLTVHRLGFGAIPIMRVSDEDTAAMVKYCLKGGMDYFDTAQMYGESERRIGMALKGMSKQDLPVLASKSTKT